MFYLNLTGLDFCTDTKSKAMGCNQYIAKVVVSNVVQVGHVYK
jgi:hypothetical protein